MNEQLNYAAGSENKWVKKHVKKTHQFVVLQEYTICGCGPEYSTSIFMSSLGWCA